MKEIVDYCMVVDNAVNSHLCEYAINAFEKYSELHDKHDSGQVHFTQMNVTQKSKTVADFAELQKFFETASLYFLDLYKKEVPETKLWPAKYGYEEFRMKRYLPNNYDRFDGHIDAADRISCKRFLAFFWYLNTVEEGGETEFLNVDFKVPAKQGRLLIFPPMWMYPHKGNMPISGPKYLFGSYLHFI